MRAWVKGQQVQETLTNAVAAVGSKAMEVTKSGIKSAVTSPYGKAAGGIIILACVGTYAPAAYSFYTRTQKERQEAALLEAQIDERSLQFLGDVIDRNHDKHIKAFVGNLERNRFYYHRAEEAEIIDSLLTMLSGSKCCVVVFGPKSVGKSTMMKRILCHLAGKRDIKIQEKFNDRVRDTIVARNKKSIFDCFRLKYNKNVKLIYIPCALDDVKSQNDIGALVAGAMIHKSNATSFAARVGEMITERVEFYKRKTDVIMYFHINSIGGEDVKKLNHLTNYLRSITTRPGIACFVEISKSYLPPMKELGSKRVDPIRVVPLNDEEGLDMAKSLSYHLMQLQAQAQAVRDRSFWRYYDGGIDYVRDKIGYPTVETEWGNDDDEKIDILDYSKMTSNDISLRTHGLPGYIYAIVVKEMDKTTREIVTDLKSNVGHDDVSQNDIRVLYSCVADDKTISFAMDSQHAAILNKFKVGIEVTGNRMGVKDIPTRDAILSLKKKNYGLIPEQEQE